MTMPDIHIDQSRNKAKGDIKATINLYDASASGVTSLHQLRKPVGDFVGREALLDDLTEKLKHGSVSITSVRGLGGIGKTELALKIGHRLCDTYPDAQFFFELKGTDGDGMLSTSDAMGYVIRAYHPDAKLPDDEGQVRGMYLSVLEGKRVLLLMDNAGSQAQVEPLMPPKGSAMLVTTRQRFTLPGLGSESTVDLDELPRDEACQLLLAICPRIGGCADEIADLCGDLPLGLRVAGGTLATRDDLGVDRYVERLKKKRLENLPEVEASLGLSYELLDAAIQQRFTMLGVFPGSFDRQAAQTVWGLGGDEEGSEDALGGLRRYNLLQWDAGERRYRLHDLVRVFAHDHSTDEDRAAAELRHAQHYEAVLRVADELYLQGDDSIFAGLGLFDRERVNIEAGFGWAQAHLDRDEIAAGLCIKYPDAGVYVLNLRLHPRECVTWLEAQVAAAKHLGYRKAEGAALGNLGIRYVDLGDPKKAIKYYKKALVVSREFGDRHWEGVIRSNLANACADLGDPKKAIEYHEEALGISREIGNWRGEGSVLGNLGNCYVILRKPKKAIEYFEEALVIDHEISNREWEYAAQNGLGNAYANLGQLEKAIEYYEKTLVIVREIGDRQGRRKQVGTWGFCLKNKVILKGR